MPLDSSPTPEDTPAPGANDATTISDGNSQAAPSSSTEGQKAEGSIVDAVKAALKAPEAEGSPTSKTTQDSTPGSETDPAKATEGEKDPEELTAEEEKSLKPKTQKAIARFRTQISGLKTQVEGMSPKAQEFDKLVNFIGRNALTNEDVNSIFEIGALVRKDPAKALEKLLPVVQQLHQMVGNILPADLKERVRLGYISEADALELNRSRRREALTRQQSDEERQQTEQQRETERRQGIVRDVSGSMEQWETAKKASDPDYHLKAQRIEELVELDVHKNGYPETAKDARERIEKIYDRVTKEIRKLVPKPSGKQPVVAGGSSSETVAEPKSLLEAIRIGMSR